MQKRFKKIIILIGAFLICTILIFGGYKYFREKPMRHLLKRQAQENAPKKTSMAKKAVLIIAFKDFRDEEYFKTQEVLFKGEIDLKVASNQKGTAVGADGGEVNIDMSLDEIKVDEFDAVVFIGGPGAPKYLDNEKSYKIAREALEKNKILAAICISPTILAKAGVLNGKKATVWHSLTDKTPINILEENNAIFVDEVVVQDGNIITGNGPGASVVFGEKILESLKSIQK